MTTPATVAAIAPQPSANPIIVAGVSGRNRSQWAL